ncbi:hypothetical protein ACLOJK_000102 [Asimina triloba]
MESAHATIFSGKSIYRRTLLMAKTHRKSVVFSKLASVLVAGENRIPLSSPKTHPNTAISIISETTMTSGGNHPIRTTSATGIDLP